VRFAGRAVLRESGGIDRPLETRTSLHQAPRGLVDLLLFCHEHWLGNDAESGRQALSSLTGTSGFGCLRLGDGASADNNVDQPAYAIQAGARSHGDRNAGTG